MFTLNSINHKQLLIAVFVSSSFYTISLQAANIVFCTNTNFGITATTTHFTDNNDGTISDPETELIWKKCSEGQSWDAAGNDCTGVIASYNWQAALQRVQVVNTGTGENFSQSDWRVPNIKELTSIVEFRCKDPAINKTIFPGTPGILTTFFWSSSPYATGSDDARGVFFNKGGYSRLPKDTPAHVRLVRSGQ